MKGRRCVILGGGGHARVLIEAMRREGRFDPCAITDSDAAKAGSKVDGVPVVGDDSALGSLRGVRHFVVGVGAVADNERRRKVFERGMSAGLKAASIRHPSSVLASNVSWGEGTVVLAGAIVNPGARLGCNVIVNTGAIVEHDCTLDDHVHVAPRGTVCGGVTVGKGAFIGAGACVREGVRIGPWAVVGAGAVVLKDVPARATVVGIPARAR